MRREVLMSEVRKMLDDVLTQLDSAQTLEQHEVSSALDSVGRAAKESGETINELQYEFIAVYLNLYDERREWGTFYAPIMSIVDDDGTRHDSPPLTSITPECIAYWIVRMRSAKHPTLRARYADLVWDLSRKATGNRPIIEAARIAVEGYAETLITLPKTSTHSWGHIGKRSVDIALSINDKERLRTAVAANVAYANAEVDEDERDFRQRSLFTILKDIPPNRRPQCEFQAVIDDFRRRLETLDAAEADQFSIDRYALPLADHYWSSQQPEEAKAVIRVYGAAVQRMADKATMATLAVGWLKQLYDLYRRFEMNDEGARVLKRMVELQPRVPNDLVTISTSQNIPQEEIDEWLNWLVTDDIDESFANLTGHFIPNLDEMRRQLEDLKNDYPLSQMFAATLVDHHGRAVAEIDPNNAEGKLIRQVNQGIHFRSTFLELGFQRLFKKHSIGPDELFSQVTKSPVWHESRHPVLKRGIEAYFAEDPIVAIHILVTEIENAVRVIGHSLRLSIQKRNRLGGFDLKNLADFLADDTVAGFLTEGIVTYLRVVLTDRRGWNLRNDTCHGILRAESFSKAASRQLLHIILVLSAVRAIGDLDR